MLDALKGIFVDCDLYVLLPFIFMLGAAFGSFSSFIGHRIFHHNLKITAKRSVCFACNSAIKPLDVVPVLGFILLRGKCRSCCEKIPLRYIALELGCGLLFAVIFVKYHTISPIFIAMMLVLAVLSFIHISTDSEYRMASDTVSVIFAVISFLLANLNLGQSIYRSFFLALIGGFAFWLLGLAVSKKIGRESLGFGDVKIVASMAPLVSSMLSLVLMMLCVGLVGIAHGFWQKNHTKESEFPFAISLVIGFWVSLIAVSNGKISVL